MNNKLLSKEEILKKFAGLTLDFHEEKRKSPSVFIYIKKCMDEYARQEAIGFFEYLEDGSKYNSPLSSDQLYEKYIESKTREKEK